MAEVLPAPQEQMLPSDTIADAMYTWLSKEIASSDENKNAYLNNAATSSETGQAKAPGHYDRLELWTTHFEKDNADPTIISMQLFGIQTGLSGAFREQCHYAGKSQGDYMRRRHNGYHGPLGIDIAQQVDSQLQKRFGYLPGFDDLAKRTVDPEELASETKRVNEFGLKTLNQIHGDPRISQTSQRPLFYYLRLGSLQKEWLNLGVDYVLHAAYVNGGKLDEVTFLEPKTISEAKPYKPFQQIAT